MDEKSSWAGRILYAADKAAALLIALKYDRVNNPPTIKPSDDTVSKRDAEEIKIIAQANGVPVSPDDFYLASEMWAVDYFISRDIARYDDTGFFTALIVMYTLIVRHGKWYRWRESYYD